MPRCGVARIHRTSVLFVCAAKTPSENDLRARRLEEREIHMAALDGADWRFCGLFLAPDFRSRGDEGARPCGAADRRGISGIDTAIGPRRIWFVQPGFRGIDQRACDRLCRSRMTVLFDRTYELTRKSCLMPDETGVDTGDLAAL